MAEMVDTKMEVETTTTTTTTAVAMEVESTPASSVVETTPHLVNGENDEDIKLIVLNYGKWKDAKAMDAFLRAQNVTFRKVQKSRQLSFGFVHFHTQEERDAAIPLLRELEWNGDKMDVKTALPRKSVKPHNTNKRPRDENHSKSNKKQNQDEDDAVVGGGDAGDAPVAEAVKQTPKHARDVVTPWATVPYEEQLERKENEMRKVLVKIVRQTRKEYFKKEKRVNAEQQRHRKKQKTAAKADANDEDNEHDDNEAANDASGKRELSTYIPTWLTSHGSLYVVADGVLFSRPHEGDASSEWTRVVDAPHVLAIVSFGSELVAATAHNTIQVLKQGPDAMYWEKLCDGPGADESLVSLTSLRGFLLGCTASGKLLKQEGMGRFATGKWTELAQVPGAKAVTIHNGFVYALCADASTQNQWRRASLTADALDALVFEDFDWKALDVAHDAVLGLCSHDHQLILLSGRSLLHSNPDGDVAVESTVALNLNSEVATITGFASHKGLCCPMDSIHASPTTVGYRNKCEFSIGFDANEKPCVGFRMGLFRDGSVIVSPPTDCVNVSPVMVTVCEAMQRLLETSDVPVYDVKTQVGVWRQLTVRFSERTQQLMVVLQINPKGLAPEEIQRVRDLTLATFKTNCTETIKVTSLFTQEYAGVSAASEDDPLVHLYGDKTIEELLMGKRFSVSPNAFFQVNTEGAEALYSLVRQHANADADTLLYDVCCGTGTIGICASAGAGKVVGIEICKAATDDAAVNAELNGVTNVTFVNSKAEDVMKDLLKAKQEGAEDTHLKRVVAIVDPPRAGLHHQVLRSLRSCPPVERIVYVSCNPTASLIQDAMMLCGPKTKSVTGNAFRPVHAIPVDMFPHTPHCEMIIVFDRVSKASNA